MPETFTITNEDLEAIANTGQVELSPGITLVAGDDFPQGIVGNRRVIEVSAGFGTIVAVAGDGTVWYWGAKDAKWFALPPLPGAEPTPESKP